MGYGSGFWIFVLVEQIICILIILILNLKSYFIRKSTLKYFTDTPDDLPPTIVSLLLSSKNSYAELFSSEVSLMITKGILKGCNSNNELVLKIVRIPNIEDKLYPYQRSLFNDILLKHSNEDGVIDFKNILDDRCNVSKSILSNVLLVILNFSQSNLSKPNHTKRKEPRTYAINNMLVIFIICFLNFEFLFNKLFIVSSIFSIITIFIARKDHTVYLSKEGLTAYKKWTSFKLFLKEYGRFEDRGIRDIVLWRKFLVYANSFGLADKLTDEVDNAYTKEITKLLKKTLIEVGLGCVVDSSKVIRRKIKSL